MVPILVLILVLIMIVFRTISKVNKCLVLAFGAMTIGQAHRCTPWDFFSIAVKIFGRALTVRLSVAPFTATDILFKTYVKTVTVM